MSKLHELLAIEGSHKTQEVKVGGDLRNLFDKNPAAFVEHYLDYKYYTEELQRKGHKPAGESERKNMSATVMGELESLAKIMAKSWDISHRVGFGNTLAKADIILDDNPDESKRTVLAKDVPATVLLDLEKRATGLQTVIHAIKPYNSDKNWTPVQGRDNVLRMQDEVQIFTQNMNTVLTLAQATEKFPAQAKEVVENVPMGTKTKVEFTGSISDSQKGEMLARVDQLIRAIKAARSRANNIDVPAVTPIGDTLIDFVLGKK